MNSGDLIKQKKDRVVYNSIQGQTKPTNKTTPKRFEVVLQERLGPRKVYTGNQVILPACECGGGGGGGGSNFTMTTLASTVSIEVEGTGIINWGDGHTSSFSGYTSFSNEPTSGNITIVSSDLIYLVCNNNQLTSLDVSGLTTLQELYCQSNQLSSLNVSGLTALTVLYCFSNQLTSLNVSGLIALTVLYCQLNQLSSLIVSGLTALVNLYCNNNQLSSLDVSGLTSLQRLYCDTNQLSQSAANTIVADLVANLVDNGQLRILTVSPSVSNPGIAPWTTLTGGTRLWTIS